MPRNVLSKTQLSAHLLTPLGHQIRAVRNLRGLSLRDLSEQTGIDHTSLGRYERGERNYTLATLWAVAAALDCDLEIALYPTSSPGKAS